MASVKNLILNFVFQTQGAGSATQDLNNLSKAQTRLGQSSASAGRTFSSQAQGLGGLVAAYAGAAATTFALQQAFDKLAKSARAIQTLEGLNTLASSVGASGSQLLESVREITKAQLTIAESAAQINLSLSAGFNTQQIERLSGVALKASRALGRDLNDAYTRVVRGSAKMETELLDELGIYTKIEPATRAYAASIGKSVTALSEYERRQAFVNAVITEGERKYSSINTTLATTAEKLEAFGTKMLDIAMIFGMELVQRLEPIIDFFSENFPAAVALAMAAAGMLARKGIGELSNYLAMATQQKLQNAIALENLVRRYTGLAPATIKASEAIGKLSASTMGLNAAEKARFDTLKATSQVRALTRAELGEVSKLSQKVADSYINQRNAIRAATITQEQNNRTIQQEFRDRQNALNVLKQQQAAIRANSALTRADRQAQLQALAPTVQAAQNRVNSILPDARQSAADTKAMLDQYRALNNAQQQYTNAVRTSGAAMTGWAAKSAAVIGAVGRAWSIATAGVLAFTAKLVSGLGFVISAVAIFTIAGTALAKLFGVSEELSALFSQLLQAATRFLSGGALKSTKTALEGIASSTIGELEKVNKEFKNIENFVFKKKFLGIEIEVEVSKEDLVRRATSAVSDVVTDRGFISQSINNATNTGMDIGRALAAGLIAGVVTLSAVPTGGLSLAAGAAIAGAVGVGFAAGAAETTKEQGDLNAQLDITSERVNELKSQYVSAFSELNSGLEGQDVKLAAVLQKEAERIGATEILNAEQQLYLDSFADVIVSQLNQIKNLETLITLSRALGKTSGQIADSFDISPDASKTFSRIQAQLEQVAGQDQLTVPVSLTLINTETGLFPEIQKQLETLTAKDRFKLLPIDIGNDKELRAVFNNVKARIDGYSDDILNSIKNTGSLEGAIEELGNAWFKGGATRIAKDLQTLGLTTEDVLKVLDPLSFDVLANLTNQFNEGGVASVRAADNFNTLVKNARDGSTTFEQFQQDLGGVDNALSASNASLAKVIPELRAFKDNAPDEKTAAFAESLLQLAVNGLESNKTIKNQLNLLAEQESYYRRIVEFAGFLKTIQDSTKINFFDYEAQVIAAETLVSAEQARLSVLLSRVQAEKVLADQAKAALASPEGRDRQGRISEANAQQRQALSDYEQTLDSVVATLMTMRPEMIKQVSEADKLNKELDKQVTAQEKQLSLVRAQAAQEEKLIALRASAAAADLAVFNAEQELDALKNQIDLSKNIFSLEEKRADRAKELIDSINETTQAGYDRQIDAIQAIERAENRASETRLANIDKQIQRISGLRDLAKNVDQAITALQLSFLKAPTITQDSPDESFNVEISLRRQLLAEEISAAEQSAKNQRDILQLQAQKEISAIQAQQAQLDLELGLQQKRESLLKDQLGLIKLSEQKELDLLRLQDEARRASAALELENLEAQKKQTADKYVQDFQAIEAEKQLSIKKATDDIDANIRYLESIRAQSDVFNDFLDNYGALIAAQAEVVGKQIDLPARDVGEQDFNTIINNLEASKSAVTDSYTNLFSLQAEALSIATGSSQKALDQEIAAIEARVLAENDAFEKTIEAREAARDVTVSAAQEELDAVTQNVSLIISERARLADKVADIERNLNTELKALADTTAESQTAAQNKFIDFILDGLKETISAMEDAKSRYQDVVIDMASQIRDIQAQRVDIKVQFEIDRAAFERQMEEVRKQYEIERLQADVKLIEAKESSGSMSAIDAAKAVNDKQQEILSAQRQLVELERRNALAALADQDRIALAQAEEAQRRIRAEADLAADKIQAEMQLIVEYGNLYQAQIESLEEYSDNSNKGTAAVFNQFLGSLQVLFQDFGSGLAGVLKASTGADVAFAVKEAIAINAEEIARVEGSFTDATTSMIEWGVSAQDAIRARAREEQALEADKYLNTRSRIQQEVAATNAAFDQKTALLETQNLIETENAKARIKSAEEAGKKENKKLEDIRKDYQSAIEKLRDSIISVLDETVKAIGSIITGNLERKIEMAKVKETVVNQNLITVSEKLTEAQSAQQELMQKELSLRDEIKESYKVLEESQKTYVESLTGDDRSIKQSGQVLINNILDQKRKQVELSRTINDRIRQDTFVQSLESRKIDQERRLEQATYERLAAEQELEQTQMVLSQISNLLSGEMTKLTNSMINFVQSIAGVQNAMNAGLSAGFSQSQITSGLQGFGNQVISNLLFGNGGTGLLSNALDGLLNAGKVLTSAGSKIATAVGNTGSLAPSTSLRPPANPFYSSGASSAAAAGGFWASAGSAIAGGLQGLGVGNLVGALTKDPGMGSSIGGAIGGAIAGAFPAIISSVPVLSSIAGGISTTLGVGLGFAIPVVGAFIGAAIGRLFSKTPKAGASGKLTSEGFSMTSSYQQKVPGGTARSLNDIAGSTLTGVVDSLKAVGIAFKDVVKTSIGLRKSSITGASLQFAGGEKFTKGGSGTSQKDIQAISKFYLDSFIKGLRTGSLVVDKTVANAAELQSAIDKFVTSNKSTKTIERLKYVIDYASKFSGILAKLGEAVPVTMEDAISQIRLGSQANASAISQQYKELKEQAADVFGTTSKQYADLNKKIKENALSQLGLSEGSDGIIRSVQEATSELNAGTIAVSNIIEAILNFDTALTAAGFSAQKTSDIINIALNTQLTNFIGAIGENLQNSIDVLKNPAMQASIELAAIINNAEERTKQAEGVLAGIRSAESRIEQSNIDTAITNVSKSIELGALEVEAYLESLNIEQLKAVIADEDRIDSITRLSAQTRLATLEEDDRVKATQKFVKVSREFNKSLSDIVGSNAVPQFAKLATSSFEIAQLLGKAKIDQFSIDLAALVNSIASGEDIADNFESALNSLTGELNSNNISATQLVEALDLLQQTTVDSIEVYKSLVSAVEETATEIANIYSSLLDNLVSTTDDIGGTLLDLLDTFQSKSLDILKIYDSTLIGLASSGNEIFDLRDAASDAYNTAATAVAEFEKANKLSGKSSTQVSAQIADIQSQLDSLSSKPFDFASFLEFGKLTSQQRALQAELKTLSTTEKEYSKLLSARETALLDLAFADSTIQTLGSDLVDTRRTESETIQKLQDASTEFARAQSDLEQITRLLAEANFDLNQARFDEEDRVISIAGLLTELAGAAISLETEVSGLNSAFLDTIKSAAQSAAEIKYASEEFDSTRSGLIQKAVSDVTEYYNSLVSVGEQISQITSPFTSIIEPVKVVAEELDIYSLLITDRFKNFSARLVEYLDTDGLAIFYGQGGVFEKFRNSLLTTLVVQGFDVLTATDGPLSGFKEQLTAVTLAYSTLESQGASLDLVIDSLTTSFGNLVTAVGTGETGVVSAVQVFIDKITGEDTYTIPNFTTTEGVGKVINDYIKSVNESSNYTAIKISKETANTVGFMINSYIKSVDDSSKYTAISLNKQAGIGLLLETYLTNLNNATGFTAPTVTTTTKGGIGAGMAAFLASLNTATGFTAPTLNTATAGTIGNRMAAFLSGLNTSAVFTAPTLTTATTGTIGNRMAAFLSSLPTATGFTAPTINTATAGTIGNRMAAFLSGLSTAIGFVAPTLTTTTVGTVGNRMATFLASLNTATGFTAPTVTTATKGGVGSAMAAFLTGLNTATGFTAPALTTITKGGIGAGLNTFLASLNTATGFVAPKLTTNIVGSVGRTMQDFVSSLNSSTGFTVPTLSSKDGLGNNIQKYIDSIKNTLTPALAGVLDVFTPARQTKIESFKDAVATLDTVGNDITSTQSLVSTIASLSLNTATAATNAGSASTNIKALASDFSNLKNQIAGLFDTTDSKGKVIKGTLTQSQEAITALATRVRDAWNAVVLDANSKLNSPTVKVTSTVDAGSALTAEDRKALSTIATNSNRAPVIKSLDASGGYGVKTFATGGYVSGPGSETSDSIPAKLSNGEYVLKASAVKRIGKNILDDINSSGNLGYALSTKGRRGDSVVAHINQDEVRMLLRAGGSGTINPSTGLLEFFNKDGGAYGGLFEKEEANKLMTSFSSAFSSNVSTPKVAPGGFVRMDNAAGSPQIYPYNPGEATSLLGFSKAPVVMGMAANAMLLGSRPLEARDMGNVSRISYGIGSLAANKSNRNLNNVTAQLGNGQLVQVATSKVGIGPDEGSSSTERGGISARQNQLLSALASKFGGASVSGGINSPGLQRTSVEEYVKSLNKKNDGMFFDFYMLAGGSARNKGVRTSVLGYAPLSGTFASSTTRSISPTLYKEDARLADQKGVFQGSYSENLRKRSYSVPNPFAYGGKYAGTISGLGTGVFSAPFSFATGGLVTNKRDSVPAMLEPGEFVLRKQAVDRMGIDNAIRLNSTGDSGGDIEVEVNINNNGTSQTTIGTPEVRRENGKIVVDIILDDLRNNGPIKRQIRSMR